LLRLLDPLPSEDQIITIDGIPLQSIDRNALRSRIIALPQDTFFLPGSKTYRANLDLYDNASVTECKDVLKDIGIWPLIKERGGLDKPMEVDSLSQGQKQLFSVARAVLRARTRSKALSSRSQLAFYF
jgi:ABC-type multidrug transport system fused ATPase/permease subunit